MIERERQVRLTPICAEAQSVEELAFQIRSLITAPKVVAAAFRQDGLIVFLAKPKRHHDIIFALNGLGASVYKWEQGFMLDNGCFVSRARAGEIVLANGQVKKLSSPPELFSEDLW